MPDEPQICPVCRAELDAVRRFGPGFLVDGEPAFATSCAKCLSVALSFVGSFEDGFGAPLLAPRPWIAAAIAMRALESLREAEAGGWLAPAVRKIALDPDRRMLLRTPEVLRLARECYLPGAIVTPAMPLAFALERGTRVEDGAIAGYWLPAGPELALGELHPDTTARYMACVPTVDEPDTHLLPAFLQVESGWAMLTTTTLLETISFDESYALHVTVRMRAERSRWAREGAIVRLRAPLHLLAPAAE
jgi:hypothetical protein